MKYNNYRIMQDDPDAESGLIAIVTDADPAIAEKVMAASTTDKANGRSKWVWVRLANGDLILGVFPYGDTYIETELDPNRP